MRAAWAGLQVRKAMQSVGMKSGNEELGAALLQEDKESVAEICPLQGPRILSTQTFLKLVKHYAGRKVGGSPALAGRASRRQGGRCQAMGSTLLKLVKRLHREVDAPAGLEPRLHSLSLADPAPRWQGWMGCLSPLACTDANHCVSRPHVGMLRLHAPFCRAWMPLLSAGYMAVAALASPWA